jgi:nucleoid-associated protein YgaU
MIFKGSRYQGIDTYQVTDQFGRPVSALKIRYIPSTPAAYPHVVMGDQRLDLIAFKYYGNPEKFWLIADANTGEMDPEDLLVPGRTLLIPPVKP